LILRDIVIFIAGAEFFHTKATSRFALSEQQNIF
jgi:hypothetical protein